MDTGDPAGAIKIRNRARNFQYPVLGAGRQRQLLRRLGDKRLGVIIKRADGIHFIRGSIFIDRTAGAARIPEALGLEFLRAGNTRGNSRPSAVNAALTRSRLSPTALSGRPTILKALAPDSCTCTSIGRASTPSNANVVMRLIMTRPLPDFFRNPTGQKLARRSNILRTFFDVYG